MANGYKVMILYKLTSINILAHSFYKFNAYGILYTIHYRICCSPSMLIF